MSKLYQYLIEDVSDIQGWLNDNGFDSSSFEKVIVETVEEVKQFSNLSEALKERLIMKIRFFDEDYEFSAIKKENGKFNIIILTEKGLSCEGQMYDVIESLDSQNYYYLDKSQFKVKKYICEPVLDEKQIDSHILSIPELLVFYRIYQER